MKVDGKTQLVGVIAWPVKHSLSPAMHNAAFEALGLNWVYLPLPVPPERVGDAVRGLTALGFAGANVTVPHKQAVIPYLDRLTPAAQAIGAVNTIIVGEDGHLTGDNTDATGFLTDLRAAGIEPASWRPVLLGSGGAARAVAYALGMAGVTPVRILARTPARAEERWREMQRPLPATPTARLWPTALVSLSWHEVCFPSKVVSSSLLSYAQYSTNQTQVNGSRAEIVSRGGIRGRHGGGVHGGRVGVCRPGCGSRHGSYR